MKDLTLTHPDMAKRFNALVEYGAERGWHVSIISSTRDYAEQKALYAAWASGLRSAKAGNPDADLYASPWNWMARGSLHQVQVDGFSHALDLGWAGCSPFDIADAAQTFGLRLDVAGENWHFQWWGPGGVHPAPALDTKDDDMTPQEFATAIGAKMNSDGVVVIPLINDDLTTFSDYPFAAAMTYTHEENKIRRIRG